MVDLEFYRVRGHPPSLLNYAIWRALCRELDKDRAHPRFQKASQAWGKLTAEEREPLVAYATKIWEPLIGTVKSEAQWKQEMREVIDRMIKPAPVLLQYAVWRALIPLPEEGLHLFRFSEVEIAWSRLGIDEKAALDDYGTRVWLYAFPVVSIAMFHETTATTKSGIRKNVSHIDDWTFSALWNVAFQRTLYDSDSWA